MPLKADLLGVQTGFSRDANATITAAGTDVLFDKDIVIPRNQLDVACGRDTAQALNGIDRQTSAVGAAQVNAVFCFQIDRGYVGSQDTNVVRAVVQGDLRAGS